MKFVWDDTDADIGWYDCVLIDEDVTINKISFKDFTNAFQQENANEYHIYNAYSFEVSFGGSRKGFDYDSAYRNHRDEYGKRMYGYNGVCTHTVKDIKRWCEEYLASIYIKTYNEMINNLDTAKRRASWFVENGYGENADDILK